MKIKEAMPRHDFKSGKEHLIEAVKCAKNLAADPTEIIILHYVYTNLCQDLVKKEDFIRLSLRIN